MENYEEQDYVSKTDICSGGYKIYKGLNAKSSKGMHLYCQLEDGLAKKINFEQQTEILDRLLRSFSNMVQNETFRSP